VPTLTEALGSNDYDLISWFGVFVPAKTPDAIVSILSTALSAAVLSMSDELERIGVDARGWEGDRFDAFFRAEIPRWAVIVHMTGVREQH
jgi:tripartite-type tricarboxylate transporter receptor subunit TctC